jgi:hypothetical protein
MTESWQESAYHERFKTRSEQDQLFKARPTPNSRLQIRSKRGPPCKARPWMIVRRRSFRRRRNEPHDHFVAGETSLAIISSPAKRASRSFRRRRNEPRDHFVAGETSLTIISSPAKRASRSFRRRRNEPHDHFVAGETRLTIISSPAKRASRSFRRRRNEALTKLGLTIIHVKAPSRSQRSRRLGQHTRSLRKELFIPLHPQLVSSGDWARRPAAKQRLGQHTLPTPPTTTALRGPESAAPFHAHTRGIAIPPPRGIAIYCHVHSIAFSLSA